MPCVSRGTVEKGHDPRSALGLAVRPGDTALSVLSKVIGGAFPLQMNGETHATVREGLRVLKEGERPASQERVGCRKVDVESAAEIAPLPFTARSNEAILFPAAIISPLDDTFFCFCQTTYLNRTCRSRL